MKALWTAVLLLALAGCTGGTQPPDSTPTPARQVSVPGLAWRTLAPAPTKRTEVTAAVLGNRIYVIGGYSADGASVPTVEVYDVGTDRWSRGPDLPVAVNHAMAATSGDAVYLFGGFTGDGKPSAAAFRLADGAWRSVADLPEGRAAGGAVALDGRISVVGGVAPGGGLGGDMLVFDPGADRWARAPGMPTPREHLGAAGFDGQVYVVGGRESGKGNFTAAEAWSAADGWRTLLPMPTARGGIAAAATSNGFIVAPGGEAQDTFEEVEAFDVPGRRWRVLPSLPTPRHGLGVVAIGPMLFTLCGGPKPGLHVSDAVEAIDLASLRPG